MSSNYQKVTHCLFDMDGLLLDTEPLYTVAISNILSRYGATFTWEVKAKAMGMTGADSAKFIVNHYSLPISAEEYQAEAVAQYQIVMPTAQLLPDTEGLYGEVMDQMCKHFGAKFNSEVQLKILGRKEQDMCAILISELKLKCTPEILLQEYRKLYTVSLVRTTLMPGAERLIRHLHKHKIPIAVATSSSLDSVEIKTQKFKELFALFSHLVSGSSDPEVKNGKPSPDIFLICASRFPDTPASAKCLVFEDAPNGIQAAIAAGMQSVMVPDPRISDEQRKLATLTLNSLEDFKPELFGLPAFEEEPVPRATTVSDKTQTDHMSTSMNDANASTQTLKASTSIEQSQTTDVSDKMVAPTEVPTQTPNSYIK